MCSKVRHRYGNQAKGGDRLINERYYYSNMSKTEQNVYRLIYNGIKQFALNIVIELEIPISCIQETYLKVLYDNPYFYYINQTVIKISGSYGYYLLMPEYIYTPAQTKEIDADIRKVIDRVKEKAQKYTGDPFRLEKFLHDSVVKSVAYDYESLKKTDCFNAHSIVGAFLDNKAVCEGIAKAFKVLCNEFNIKCIVVIGKASQDGNFTDNDYHAWNLIKIYDESYHVDVTWDNCYEKDMQYISYDYFNLTTEDISLDHQPICELPVCNATRLNYFYSTGSFVSTYRELIELIEKRFTEKRIVFRALKDCREFRSTKELQEKSITALMHTMFTRKNTRSFKVMFNAAQNIVNIIFEEDYVSKIDITKYPKGKKK